MGTLYIKFKLGLILDSKLSFISHINEKISKAHKGLGIIKSLSRPLSVKTLDLIFKLYIRPHLDFCDVIFHMHVPYACPIYTFCC